MKLGIVLLVISPTVLFLSGCEKSYNECVLTSMKGVTSDLAAKAIAQSCAQKFEEKKPQSVTLPSEAVEKLTGNAKMEVGFIDGGIYNGNYNWTVTSVTIGVRYKSSGGVSTSREYKIDTNIKPLSQSTLLEQVGPNDKVTNFQWGIVTASGYQGAN